MAILSCRTVEHLENGFEGSLTEGFVLRVEFLEDGLLRVAVVPSQGFEIDRTWMIAPDGDVPLEGRDRLATNGFRNPKTTRLENGAETETLRVTFERDPLLLTVFQKIDGVWCEVLRDRRDGAYQWLPERGDFLHFQARQHDARHYGLGDKTGPIDRTRRRFRCLQTDALGYDAELSDPLYKHAPFFMVENTPAVGKRYSTGLLYDTFSEIAFDFGCEHSNYFEPFRHVSAQEEGLIYYVLAGPRLRDIVPRLAALTGKPALPPRWSFGFAFSAMAHTDAVNAPQVISDFARRCRDEHFPISAIHFGSGYSMHADGCRYVFDWNFERYPNRDSLFETLNGLGFRTCANIKPVLLNTHTAFEEAEKNGWFVQRADGSPAVERFWDGFGAQLDFSNPGALNWWGDGVRTHILGAGFDGAWNDNNEAELWDETAKLNGFGKVLSAIKTRPLHALLMTRTSFETIAEKSPKKRPYTISRGGPIGIARYGETWTGDNETSWHSLKWNLRQGLSMSLSGFPLTGHDIGGFSGPSPDAELLVRWFQMMVLHPRAVMNSWKPNLETNANLPFMYDDANDAVRAALQLRYQFLPLIYSLAYQAHQTGAPIIRPLLYEFDDEICRKDNDCFMLGRDLLVAPVVEAGGRQVHISLPATQGGWFSVDGRHHFDGGRDITLPAAFDTLPMLVRAGGILPFAESWQDNSPHDAEKIAFHVYPPGKDEGASDFTLLDDDGERHLLLQEDACVPVRLSWAGGKAELSIASPDTERFSAVCKTLEDNAFRTKTDPESGEPIKQ